MLHGPPLGPIKQAPGSPCSMPAGAASCERGPKLSTRHSTGTWRPWSWSGSRRLCITQPSLRWWTTTAEPGGTSAACPRTSSLTCITSFISKILSDDGWYSDAEKVFLSCLHIHTLHNEMLHWFRAVECCVRLLHVRNGNCKYHLGEETFKLAQNYMDKLAKHNQHVNKAALYVELCGLLFAKSHYDEANKWCIEAMKEITSGLPVKVVVDVLRQASNARVSVFGGRNIHVATAHEDLAYSYVHQYSSGKFDNALFHAERAIEIITHILPEDHILLETSKRVKALILEEIAIDCQKLFLEAHDLYLSSLQAFGEFNVQTAKQYGNLGRLYQSMQKFKEAEEMHIKAIQIKEQLFGQEDYEVALSVGHLASLYNYDMNQYENAE
ncbi:Amyloid -binding 2 [Pelobates cultripes]|uniref:Amyloid -binding 2 n=1 Tax=Pelobates cultripes TaxID=61616 RepID=A0AAD1VR49_PELCU|nr:Amyloid -binding 2 [Pelobates cultripes]